MPGADRYNAVPLESWIRRASRRRIRVLRLAGWDRHRPSDSLRLPIVPGGYRSNREAFGPTVALPCRRKGLGRYRGRLASAGRSHLHSISGPIGLLPIAGEGAGRTRPGSLWPGSRRGLAAWRQIQNIIIHFLIGIVSSRPVSGLSRICQEFFDGKRKRIFIGSSQPLTRHVEPKKPCDPR